MKHKWIIITLAIVFFLSALTVYVNKVLLPNVVKKIAVEQAQNFLKRKVEIESIKFNWLRGIVINKVKVYQKDVPDQVFIQAEKISSGIIFIPSFKTHKLILPSINIENLSVHLIHSPNNIWNFSDLLTPPVEQKPEKPSPVDVSIGGFQLTNGKIKLDDVQSNRVISELFDQINVKLGLSIPGIAIDGSLAIPDKKASIYINGNYHLINKSLKAQLKLQNIRPTDYLGFSPVTLPLTLKSGLIQEVNANVEYTENLIKVQGSWSLKDIDATFNEHHIKANLDAERADITLKNNTIALKGSYAFNKVVFVNPTLSFSGSLKSAVDDFVFNSTDDISVKASLTTDQVSIKLGSDQSFQGQLAAQISQGRWQKNSGSIQGNVSLKDIDLTLKDQRLKGQLQLNNLKATKESKQSSLEADVLFNQFNVALPGKAVSGDLKADHLTLMMENSGLIKIASTLDLTHINATFDQMKAVGSLHLNQLKASFDPANQIVQAEVNGSLNKVVAKLDAQKDIEANASFNLNVIYPLKNPAGLEYSGTIAVDQTNLRGLPFGPINDINLKASIKTNSADIDNLSLSFLETAITASGHIENLTNPIMNIQLQSDRIDLSKLQKVAPDLLNSYGLTIDGTTSFKVKFQGLALDPMSARINAQAVLKDVNVESSTFHQSVKNLSGSFVADGDSLAWEDLSANFMGQTITMTGKIVNFKNPKIITNLSSSIIELKADINKLDNLLTINTLTGHYLSASFDVGGSIDLSGKIPQLNLKNKLVFKLEDLSTFLPDLKKTLEPLKLAGLINVNASISGEASNWQKWVSTATIQSDLIEATGLKLNNVVVKLNQSEGKLQNSSLNCDAYQGTINVLSTVDLLNKDFPATANIKVANLDVASILKDFKVTQDIRGKFNLNTTLNADLMKPLGVSGQGNISILEAYLADVELFRGILSPLRAIIPTSNLILNEVSGNFDLQDQKISTNNLQFKGNIMNFLAKGWVGFDQSTQMSIEVPDDINTESPIPPEIRQSIHYSISGQLSKPKIESHFSEIKTIINVGKKILGDKLPQGISGILDQLPF